jgi:hypothetical protein
MKQIDGRTSLNEGKKIVARNKKNWDEVKEEIMKTANRAKFDQNAGLRNALLATQNTKLFECSPHDKVWGIGFALSSDQKSQEMRHGDNLQGKCLMAIRDEIREALHLKMDQK